MSPAPTENRRPSRREIARFAVIAPLLPSLLARRLQQPSTAEEPRFVAPPGEMPAEMQERLHGLVEGLRAGRRTTNDVLSDPAWSTFRPYPAFRETIREHAPTGRGVLVPKGEPGDALLVRGRVLGAEQQPCADALVYAYQTSAQGWYAAEAPHVSGNSGDFGHARLFTYVRTDPQGTFELATIRPGGYPRSDLPCHIHLALQAPGHAERITEVRFADDPRLTPSQLESSLRAGFEIVDVERTSDGIGRCSVTFELERN